MDVLKVKEYLSYNDKTGDFLWVKSYRNQNTGKLAGSFDSDGYRTIKIFQKSYRAHRLAWFYVYGVWPVCSIDHIDGQRDNNAISNLREVTFAGNSQNQRKSHSDAVYASLGVDKLTNRKLFRSRIQSRGKRITLGYFKTEEEAGEAYLLAKRTLHKTCTI